MIRCNECGYSSSDNATNCEMCNKSLGISQPPLGSQPIQANPNKSRAADHKPTQKGEAVKGDFIDGNQVSRAKDNQASNSYICPNPDCKYLSSKPINASNPCPKCNSRDYQVQSPVQNRDHQVQSPIQNRDHQVQSPVQNRDHRVQPPVQNRDYQVQSPVQNRDHRVQPPVQNNKSKRTTFGTVNFIQQIEIQAEDFVLIDQTGRTIFSSASQAGNPEIIIGRSNINPHDKTISSQHVKFTSTNQGWKMEDLSSNGLTFIQVKSKNANLARGVLEDDMAIILGKNIFKFRRI